MLCSLTLRFVKNWSQNLILQIWAVFASHDDSCCCEFAHVPNRSSQNKQMLSLTRCTSKEKCYDHLIFFVFRHNNQNRSFFNAELCCWKTHALKKLLLWLFLLTTACFIVISAALVMPEGKANREKKNKIRDYCCQKRVSSLCGGY